MTDNNSIDSSTYHYWKADDPAFQEKITIAEEFRRFSLPRELEESPKYGEYYKQQYTVAQFLQIWDYIIIDHDPGVGKTDAGVLASKMFEEGRQLSPEDAYLRGLCNTIEGTIIFTPSSTVDITWANSFQRWGQTVSKDVSFYHYEEFFKSYKNNKIAAIAKLNNKFIIMDEIQRAVSRSKKDEEDRDRYNFYVEILESTPIKKLAIMTGSLLTIDTKELAYIANLLPRGESLKMPSDDDAWHENLGKISDAEREEILRPYLNGILSRIKSVQRYAKLVWPEEAVDINVPGSSFYRVVNLPMTKEHEAIYLRKIKSMTEFNMGGLQYSLSGFDKDDNISEKSIDDIKKFAPIIHYAGQVVNRQENRNKKAFIVSRWLPHGIKPMERMLELLGYENLNKKIETMPRGSPFPDNRRKRFAVLEAVSEAKIEGRVPGSSSFNTTIIDYFNADKNQNGEYLQIILSSEVGTTSISLYSTTIVMILDPALQLQTDIQRRDRVFRAAAHQKLFAERIKQGMSELEAIVPVIVYYFSTYAPNIDEGDRIHSLTLAKYRDNASRDLKLEPIRRVEQRLAFDAQLSYERNKFASIVRGQPDVGFSGRDSRFVESDKSRYESIYTDVKDEKIYEEATKMLLSCFSLDVDLFVHNYSQNNKKNEIKIFRSLAKLLHHPAIVKTPHGETTYLHLDSKRAFLYLSPEKFENNTLYTLSAYVDSHRTLYVSTIAGSRKQHIPKYKNWEEFEKYLDEADKDVQNKTLNTRIEEIENALAEGPDGEFYKKLLLKYPRSIFLIKKPIKMIEILSGIDKRARRKAYRGFVVENIAGAEDVLFHVFRCQRIIDKNCSYNILTMQTSAKYISVFNPSNKTFVVLDQDSPEQITYSEIASELILKDYNSWLEKYERNTDHMLAIPENERRKIEKQSISLRDIYGVFFRPENVFRIQDMRTNAVYFTASGKVNKSKKPKTKKNFSYSVEELIDIILYLHIEDSLIEKIGSDPRLFAANLERQKNELRRASYDDILTLLEKNLNGVSSKPIDLSSFRENSDTVVFEDDSDTEINEAQQEQAVIIDQYDSKKKNKKEPSALLKLLANRRKYYINHPDRFLLFYIFYVNKDMGKYPSKDTHVEILQEHFKQENRIYEFR